MSFVDEMRNLREDIESGKEVRSRRLKEIKDDLSAFRRENRAQQRELKKELSAALAAFWGKKSKPLIKKGEKS